jgi:hypothetical protein
MLIIRAIFLCIYDRTARKLVAGVGVPSRPKKGDHPAGPGGPSYPLLEVGAAGIDAAVTIARQIWWTVAALISGVRALGLRLPSPGSAP